MSFRTIFAVLSLCCAASLASSQEPAPAATRPSMNFGKEPGAFPVAVWLQQPRNAQRYHQIGINLYIGLWRGPTEAQLEGLSKAGMYVVCAQNEVSMKSPHANLIVGWMHGDEPDNAQADGKWGWGPPIPPKKIIADYLAIKHKDPKRPVVLNLGQGVAWDGWIGRGVRSRHPEDYEQYVKGCDIASYDIYPATATHKDVAGKLWLVAYGVDRLKKWAGERPVWCCIETTYIGNPRRKPTPKEVKAEVWMAITHGAKGLIYFAHQFKPKEIEAGLLADAEMSRAVGEINCEVQRHAPVLAGKAVSFTSSEPEEVSAAMREHEGKRWLFAVESRGLEKKVQITPQGKQKPISLDLKPWEVKILAVQ